MKVKEVNILSIYIETRVSMVLIINVKNRNNFEKYDNFVREKHHGHIAAGKLESVNNKQHSTFYLNGLSLASSLALHVPPPNFTLKTPSEFTHTLIYRYRYIERKRDWYGFCPCSRIHVPKPWRWPSSIHHKGRLFDVLRPSRLPWLPLHLSPSRVRLFVEPYRA